MAASSLSLSLARRIWSLYATTSPIFVSEWRRRRRRRRRREFSTNLLLLFVRVSDKIFSCFLSWYWARFFPKISSKLIRFSFRVCYSGDCLCDSRELQRIQKESECFWNLKGCLWPQLLVFGFVFRSLEPRESFSSCFSFCSDRCNWRSQQFFSPLGDSVGLAVKKLFCKRFADCFRVSKSCRSFV